MYPLSWLRIDLSRLETNLADWRGVLGHGSGSGRGATRICAVVKAGAYGLGATQIARQLVAKGADMLAVYSVDQAEELFELGISVPVLTLMPTRSLSTLLDVARQAANRGQWHLSIHDPAEITVVQKAAQRFGCRLPVHLYVDTGMSRGGLSAGQLAKLLQELPDQPGLKLAGVYTHFASADADEGFVAEQLHRLDFAMAEHLAQLPKDLLVHVASTFSACRHSRYHRDMVRLGLGLFGYGPSMLAKSEVLPGLHHLAPTVRWTTRLVQVRRFSKNATVGYGRTHTLARESTLGLLPAGYGDGYPFVLGNRSVVQLGHNPDGRAITAPVIGHVNMDQLVVDLTDVGYARPGDPVDLISDDPTSPCSLERLAELADTNCYELLCRLSARLPRQYVGSDPT